MLDCPSIHIFQVARLFAICAVPGFLVSPGATSRQKRHGDGLRAFRIGKTQAFGRSCLDTIAAGSVWIATCLQFLQPSVATSAKFCIAYKCNNHIVCDPCCIIRIFAGLRLLPIGILQDVIAPLLWEGLEDSSLHRFCGLEPSATWDDVRVSFTAKALA